MREIINWNEGWLFHRGDVPVTPTLEKMPLYMQAKTERMKQGPACKDYRTAPEDASCHHDVRGDRWEWVTLPHDYIIFQTPDQNENCALGYFSYENAWYRKEFLCDEQDRGKRITLLFEGVATHATVYLNGCLLKRNYCGYTEFEVDLTDFLKFGEPNILAVYVNTQEHEGWWYEGGGIYRNVILTKTDPVCMDLWGVYAKPQLIEGEMWQVALETEVRNDRKEARNVQITSRIVDPDGVVVAEAAAEVFVEGYQKATATETVHVTSPRLWDVEEPNLYRVVTALACEGSTDETETTFGFRTFFADPNRGFFLNGRPIKIKGLCGHQDFGITGKAVPDTVLQYKVKLMKEMGANGFRCSHYPHSGTMMDCLDRAGFLVMAETRWFDSSPEGIGQLEMLVRRDRNHPSVIFWSLGDEEQHHVTEEGSRIIRRMAAAVRRLDSSRLITSAISVTPLENTIAEELDVIGINYNLPCYEEMHRKFPDKPLIASECCATGTGRGWYRQDSPVYGMMEAYDKDPKNGFSASREDTWKMIAEKDWILGGYQWIAFEHRGECVWPRLCSLSGAIDLFLQKKDAFYQNQAYWTNQPMLHLLPHWNWKGEEGEPVRVVVYTNCEEAELFCNDISYGKQKIPAYRHGEWTVPFQPGRLSAVGYQKGELVAADEKETTGFACALGLRAMMAEVSANGRDVALVTCYATDEQGREVPDASPFVSFTVNGAGYLIGTGSGITDHTPPYLPERKMVAGRITVAIQTEKQPGVITLYAQADGLKTAVLHLPVRD